MVFSNYRPIITSTSYFKSTGNCWSCYLKDSKLLFDHQCDQFFEKTIFLNNCHAT